MSQPDLAAACGVSKGDISRHERNDSKSNPSVDALARIALALKVQMRELFEPVGSPIPRPDEEAGHVNDDRKPGNQILEVLAETVDGEVPAEDTARGDIIKAIAVLVRALGRHDSGTVVQTTAKTGR